MPAGLWTSDRRESQVSPAVPQNVLAATEIRPSQAPGELARGRPYRLARSKSRAADRTYWVAATSPKQATGAVQLVAGPTWNIKLLNRRLTPTQVAELNLRPDDVRRISPLP
jgi:hypothetical protein